MQFTLLELCGGIRAILSNHSATDGANELCDLVSKALTDKDFIDTHLPDRKVGEHPRKILYEDPAIGFCVCGHVYDSAAIGEPHDHGTGWALYGQAVGNTEMTEWEIVNSENLISPKKLVRPEKTYVMHPGDTEFYNIGVVHSPKRVSPTKIIRIESQNLDHVVRSNIEAVSKSVN